MLIIGTNCFVSYRAAYSYYREAGYDFAATAEKFRSGEIAVGEPERLPGERIITTDNGRRYTVIVRR